MFTNGIIYPIILSAIKSFQNLLTKSELLDFIKLASKNSVLVFFIYKHLFKTILYIIIAILLYLFNKNRFNDLFNLITNTFTSNIIHKNKKNYYIIFIIILYGILEILNGYLFYNSLIFNNLNKFVIYIVIFSILFNGILSYFIYHEKFNAQLLFGYAICIIGVLIVKFN